MNSLISINKKNKIRAGSIHTLHGDIEFPSFLPDATYGTISHLTWDDLKSTNTREIVTNTLHLEQKLGSQYLANQGGFHKFTGWDRPVISDSGGFQVFSLIHRNKNKENKITDAGCSFIDFHNGKYNFLSPETSQIIQHNIGSDIRIVLDEPVIGNDSIKNIKQSVKRTTLWAKRSKKAFLETIGFSEKDYKERKKPRPLLSAVIQGASNFNFRKQSALELVDLDFDIYGFGGVPIKHQRTWDYTDKERFFHELFILLADIIPENRIRYGLGVGTPDDLIFAIENGWDIFDTVLPTRNARHGFLYVSKGQGDVSKKNFDILHIKNTNYENDTKKIDTECECLCCTTTSRNYLRYLIKNKYPTGLQLASIHNLTFFQKTISSFKSN